ncbi:Lrp/AsnC family transcriptional regulator [Candidatus Woesearchaeota archaeon]|nr:Lrp/AsnC family transcriptional regulator [Candidatus Woesearchaeota archaeon]
MAYKLDVKEKKILYELDLNARTPTTQLAKKVKLSQPATHYRLNNLIKKGVIKFFLTNIDYGFFGYFPYRFFTRLQNLTEAKEKELIDYLKDHEYVPFLASCTGRYDLMFCVMARNISELKKTINEIKNKYGEYFSEQQIATIITGEFYPRDYLLSKEKRMQFSEKEFGEQITRPKLDKKDLMILKEISNNCRITSLELSEKIKLSLDAVRYRLKNLEKNKIINGYTIYLDNELLNQFRYKIMIQINGPNEEKEKKILSFAKQFSNVVYSVKTFGIWDLEIDVEVNNPERFNEILREIKNNNSGLIKEYNTIQLTNVHKYTHLPMKAEKI